MGLFGFKKKEVNDAVKLLEEYEQGKIDGNKFLEEFGKAKVFYSTPFGDHKDGTQRPFILPAKDGTGYLPVFSTIEHMKEFYDEVGRVAYIIMEGEFSSFLDTTRKINEGGAPIKLGAVIEPKYNGITIDAKYL